MREEELSEVRHTCSRATTPSSRLRHSNESEARVRSCVVEIESDSATCERHNTQASTNQRWRIEVGNLSLHRQHPNLPLAPSMPSAHLPPCPLPMPSAHAPLPSALCDPRVRTLSSSALPFGSFFRSATSKLIICNAERSGSDLPSEEDGKGDAGLRVNETRSEASGGGGEEGRYTCDGAPADGLDVLLMEPEGGRARFRRA